MIFEEKGRSSALETNILMYKPLARRRVYKTRRLYAIRDVPTFCIGTVIAMWEILEEDKSPWSQNYCE